MKIRTAVIGLLSVVFVYGALSLIDNSFAKVAETAIYQLIIGAAVIAVLYFMKQRKKNQN